MGLTSLSFIEKTDPFECIDAEGFEKFRAELIEKMRQDSLFDRDTPENWVENCPAREVISFLKGFCLGLKASPEKTEEVQALVLLISQMESKLEAIKFIKSTTLETEEIINWLVSEFREKDSVMITKEVRSRLKTVGENALRSSQLLGSLL